MARKKKLPLAFDGVRVAFAYNDVPPRLLMTVQAINMQRGRIILTLLPEKEESEAITAASGETCSFGMTFPRGDLRRVAFRGVFGERIARPQQLIADLVTVDIQSKVLWY